MELVCLSNVRCCATTMRIFVVCVNLLKSMLGLLFLVLGGHMISHMGALKNLWGSGGAGWTTFFLIFLGIFFLVLGISGIVGACLPIYNWGLVLHIWLLCILLAIELLFAIVLLALADSHKLTGTVQNATKAAYKKYGGTGLKVAATMAIDTIQLEMKCCGLTAASDFTSSSVCPTWVAKNNGIYPDTCCTTYKSGCGNTTDTSTLHSSGCQSKLTSFLKSWFVTVGLVVSIFWIFQLVGLVFVFLLVNKYTTCYCCGCVSNKGGYVHATDSSISTDTSA